MVGPLMKNHDVIRCNCYVYEVSISPVCGQTMALCDHAHACIQHARSIINGANVHANLIAHVSCMYMNMSTMGRQSMVPSP